MKSILVRLFLAIFLFTSFSASALPTDAKGDAASHGFASYALDGDSGSTGDIELECDHTCHAAQHFQFSVDFRTPSTARSRSGPVIATGHTAPLPRSIDPLLRPPRA